MITGIRQKAQSNLFRVLLLIAVFSMTLGGLFVPGFFRQLTQTTQALITVNKQSISPAQFIARVQKEHERVEMFRRQFGNQADMFLNMLGLGNPQQMAYEGLVQEALLDSVANKIGLPVDENYITRQLQNPSFVLQQLSDIVPMYALERDGTINVTALRRYLQQIHMSMSDFEQLVENAVRRSTVLGLLHSAAYVSSDELREHFMYQYVSKNYAIIRFPVDRYLTKAQQTKISNEELKSFFEQENNATKRYWIPEKRTGIVWEFSPDHFDIALSQADIENYYNKNKHTKYVQSAPQIQLRRLVLKVENEAEADDVNKRMLQLKEELQQNPNLFEEYVRKYSQDKTAAQGGLSPWYTRNDLKPVVGTAAFHLSKDGDISDVLKTEEGYELIQRVGRKPKEFKTLDAVKSDIENVLKKQRFSEKFKQTMNQKISKTKPQESLKELAKKYTSKEKLFTAARDESRINNELFMLKKNNDVIHFVEDGKGFVLLLQDIAKSQAPTFESVKNKVQEDWYQHKAQKMLDEDLQKAEKLSPTKSFEEIAAQFNIPLDHIKNLSFDDKKATEEWNKKGYPISDFYDLRHSKDVKLIKKGTEGFLVQLIDTEPFNEELFNKKRADIVQGLYQENRERLQRGFVASLQRHATIKTNNDELQNIRSVK